MRRLLKAGWAPAAYLVLTLLMTYPAVVHLGSRIVSTGADTWIFWWNNWWLKEALATGQSPYYTTYLFYPDGVNLTYHSFSWLNSALWLLLEPILGATAAYNLTVLWVFPIAGWAMYLLVRDRTGSEGGAFIAGLIYAFVPYRLGQINHPTLMGTQWIPLYTLYLARAFQEIRARQMALAILFLVLTALTGWNLFLYLLIWTAVIAIWASVSRAAPVKRLVGALALILGVGVLLMMPLLAPMLSETGRADTLGDAQQDWMQSDLLAYLTPNDSHPVWGQAVATIYGPFLERSRVIFLGFGAMALLAYSLSRKNVRCRTGLWQWSALMWWLMALGPYLKLGGRIYEHILLPYYPLSRLYAFKLLKLPDRYNLMLALPVAVIAGYSVADLLDRLRRTWRLPLLLGVSIVVLFEYLTVPLPTQSSDVPQFYKQLAEQPGGTAIVELPIGLHRRSKQYMFYQTVHGQPIVGGHVSRRPSEATAFMESNPLLAGLYRAQAMDPTLVDVSRQLEELSSAGIRYLVIHKQGTEAESLAAWRDWLVFEPRFEDDELSVFVTTPQYGDDFRFRATLDDGIGIIDAKMSRSILVPEEWLEVHVGWGTQAAPEHDWMAELSLVGPLGVVAQSARFEPAGSWPTSYWGEDAVARGSGGMRIDPHLPGGTYSVTVQLAAPSGASTVGEPVVLGSIDVREPRREFALPEPGFPLDASFGDRLRLLGYDFQRLDGALQVTLHWQAIRRMPVSYKVFVHVVDPATGDVVSQSDTIPRDWTYPTTRWEASEVVSDEMMVDLSALGGARYDVYVGAYRADSGARLTVDQGEDSGELVDRLRIGEIVVP